MTIWAQVGIPDFQTYPDKNSRHYLWGELQNIKGHPASRRTKFALNQAPSVPELAEGNTYSKSHEWYPYSTISNLMSEQGMLGMLQIISSKGQGSATDLLNLLGPFRCGNTWQHLSHPSLGGPKTWGICCPGTHQPASRGILQLRPCSANTCHRPLGLSTSGGSTDQPQ